jgi:serine/threonine protein kinase
METGEVKLVDFGAADFVDSAQKKHFQDRFSRLFLDNFCVLRTRSYCPPEWFKQRSYLPLEATTWSLGILLYTVIYWEELGV